MSNIMMQDNHCGEFDVNLCSQFSSMYNFNYNYVKCNDSFFNQSSFLKNPNLSLVDLSKVNTTVIVENKISLSFINFNVNGAKRNLSFIQCLLCYDFVYLCETWLLDHESDSLLLNLSKYHIVLHKSDMNFAPKKGRPFGGRGYCPFVRILFSKEFSNVMNSFRQCLFSLISL